MLEHQRWVVRSGDYLAPVLGGGGCLVLHADIQVELGHERLEHLLFVSTQRATTLTLATCERTSFATLFPETSSYWLIVTVASMVTPVALSRPCSRRRRFFF